MQKKYLIQYPSLKNELSLKALFLVVYLLICASYLLNFNEINFQSFTIFETIHVSGGFFESFFASKSWFLFYFLPVILTLNIFSEILTNISVFIQIRVNSKKYLWKIFIRQVILFSFVYSFIQYLFFKMMLYPNIDFKSCCLMILCSFTSIVIFQLIYHLIKLRFDSYAGIVLNTAILFLAFVFRLNFFVVPTKLDNLQHLVILTCINVLLILLLGYTLKNVYLNKEIR